MKKIKIIGVFSLLVLASFANAQVVTSAVDAKYANAPAEAIYVHHSGSLFFTGEYLFYKVYCREMRSERLSRLSKVAYVELIGQNQEVVFRHKIALDKGVGASDFFIPNSTPSGNYKLVAYTHWMKNLGVEGYFQSDISIINPYRGNQTPILNNDSEVIETPTIVNSEKVTPTYADDSNGYAEFKIELARNSFKKRSPIQMTIKNAIRERGFGNYSVSVKKIDEIPVVQNHTAMSYETALIKKETVSKLQYTPEASGALLTGVVYDKQTGAPAADKDVAISIGGDDFFFKVTTTNDNGMFQFALDPYYPKEVAVVELLEDNLDNYTVTIHPFKASNYSKLAFTSFKIDKSMAGAIKKRSISNQIENGFFSVKPDTVRPLPLEQPFTKYEKFTRYNLDDYTRFKTLEEVFKEIVTAVWTANDGNGKKVVKVFHNDFTAPSEDPPLLFIDGVFVANHNDFLAYDALKVQQIGMIRNKYRFGNKDYQGVILVETIPGDYKNSNLGDFAKELQVFPAQREKQYFFQNYNSNLDFSKIPDYRSQLLWNPEIVLTTSQKELQFFTSDVVGEFEIVVEGFTQEGRPVSLREVFTVTE